MVVPKDCFMHIRHLQVSVSCDLDLELSSPADIL